MKQVKLTEICSPKQWKTIPSSELLKEGYPVYGANGVIGYYSEYNHEQPVIVITCRGATCGTINITEPKSYITGNAMCLDGLCSEINLRYLYYCLLHYDFNKVISGSAQPQITRQGLDNVKLIIGPLPEQMEIVRILSTIEKIIEARRQQLSAFDDLIKSRFVEMFGDPVTNSKQWDIVCLKDIIKHANNGMTRRGNDETGSIVLRLVELQCGYLNYTKPNRIILTKQEINRFLLKDGDFLFARVNGNPDNVGRCTYFKEIQEPVYHNDHIIRVQFKPQTISPEYLQHLLNSQYGRNEMRGKIKTSAGQYTINQDGIGSIRIPIPPLSRQNEFAAFVQQLDKSKVAIQQSLDSTRTLFDSLMQQYFG